MVDVLTGGFVFLCLFLSFNSLPPHWPSGEGIHPKSGRSGVGILFAMGFFWVESYQ